MTTIIFIFTLCGLFFSIIVTLAGVICLRFHETADDISTGAFMFLTGFFVSTFFIVALASTITKTIGGAQ